MSKIINMLADLFRTPSYEELAVRQFNSMRAELLEVQQAKEHFIGRERALQLGIERLYKEQTHGA